MEAGHAEEKDGSLLTAGSSGILFPPAESESVCCYFVVGLLFGVLMTILHLLPRVILPKYGR